MLSTDPYLISLYDKFQYYKAISTTKVISSLQILSTKILYAFIISFMHATCHLYKTKEIDNMTARIIGI